MEIPVCRYRTDRVIATAILDLSVAQSMESLANEPLVLHFNKVGKVDISLKYLHTWLIPTRKIAKKTSLVNFLFSRYFHPSKVPTVLHIDGNLLNFKLDNLIVVFFNTTKFRQRDRPVMWTI